MFKGEFLPVLPGPGQSGRNRNGSRMLGVASLRSATARVIKSISSRAGKIFIVRDPGKCSTQGACRWFKSPRWRILDDRGSSLNF